MTTKTLADFTEARRDLMIELQDDLMENRGLFNTLFTQSKDEARPVATRSAAMRNCIEVMNRVHALEAKLAILRATTDLFPH